MMQNKPSKILEIGTAVGYSAICFSKFLSENGKIDTIERDIERVEEARKNIKDMELENKINEAYEAAKNTVDGSDLYENVKKAVNEDGKDYIKAEIILDSESNYMRIRLTSDVKVITPGLNLILGSPHKTSVERVVLYEKQ